MFDIEENDRLKTMQEYRNELAMLDGNLSRISLSESQEEIARMREFAILRINRLAEYRIRHCDEV